MGIKSKPSLYSILASALLWAVTSLRLGRLELEQYEIIKIKLIIVNIIFVGAQWKDINEEKNQKKSNYSSKFSPVQTSI